MSDTMRDPIINLGFYSSKKLIHRTNDNSNCSELYFAKFRLQFLFSFSWDQQVAPQFGSCLINVQ